LLSRLLLTASPAFFTMGPTSAAVQILRRRSLESPGFRCATPKPGARWSRVSASTLRISLAFWARRCVWAAAKVVLSAWRGKGAAWLYETARLLFASPRDFLDAYFESPKVKTMMAAWGMHLDFAPDIAGGALFPYLESMTNQAFGMVIGAGGADTIVNAMTRLFAAKGGTLKLNAPVTRIEIVSGKARAVRLADGTRIEGRRAIIANLHPQLVFGRLVEPDPARELYERNIARFRAGPGTIMIHLALSRPLAWRAGEALSRFAYVHVAPDLAMMGRTYSEAASGLMPAEPVLVLGQPTAIDPGRAPSGKAVLWVHVRMAPATILGDAKGEIAAKDWDNAKEPYAERVLDILESYAPGLRAQIIGRAVHSPLDLERENPCLGGGDSLSGSHHLDQNFLFRPVPGYSRYPRRWKGYISAARPPGRARERAPDRDSCWRNRWPAETRASSLTSKASLDIAVAYFTRVRSVERRYPRSGAPRGGPGNHRSARSLRPEAAVAALVTPAICN
jgi:phytoene dehydrogenase-like protein